MVTTSRWTALIVFLFSLFIFLASAHSQITVQYVTISGIKDYVPTSCPWQAGLVKDLAAQENSSEDWGLVVVCDDAVWQRVIHLYGMSDEVARELGALKDPSLRLTFIRAESIYLFNQPASPSDPISGAAASRAPQLTRHFLDWFKSLGKQQVASRLEVSDSTAQ